jgi:hypothetical protein
VTADVISFAERRRLRDTPWCGPCSDAAGVKQYLTPHVHRSRLGSETRWSCPDCGGEFF